MANTERFNWWIFISKTGSKWDNKHNNYLNFSYLISWEYSSDVKWNEHGKKDTVYVTGNIFM